MHAKLDRQRIRIPYGRLVVSGVRGYGHWYGTGCVRGGLCLQGRDADNGSMG